MNENPYAPPVAPVADQQAPENHDRPRAVDLAVRLLWAGFAVSAIASVAVILTLPAGASIAAVVIMTAIGFAISGALSYWVFTAAWRGQGWARWVIAVLTGLAIVTIVGIWVALPMQRAGAGITTASFLVRMTLNISALVLLFSAPANAWYREMKRWR